MVIKTTATMIAFVGGAFRLARHYSEGTLIRMGHQFCRLYVAASAPVEFLVGTAIRFDRGHEAGRMKLGVPRCIVRQYGQGGSGDRVMF